MSCDFCTRESCVGVSFLRHSSSPLSATLDPRRTKTSHNADLRTETVAVHADHLGVGHPAAGELVCEIVGCELFVGCVRVCVCVYYRNLCRRLARTP